MVVSKREKNPEKSHFLSGISLTQCQKQLQEAINLPPNPERFVPQCKFDGSYEEIQCQNSTGLCWCVDLDGNKLSSTATNETVTCPTIGKIIYRSRIPRHAAVTRSPKRHTIACVMEDSSGIFLDKCLKIMKSYCVCVIHSYFASISV